MSITSLSFNFVNVYASQGAAPAAATQRAAPPAPVSAEDRCCEEQRPGGRQNRLAQAMMSALRELGLGGSAAPAPAPATSAQATASEAGAASTAPAAAANTPAEVDVVADTGASSAPAADVESAVYQFAHALFQTLRQENNSSEDDSRRAEGAHGHRRRHGHGHGHDHGSRQTYGDLPQRLEALAQTFGTPVPAAVADEPQVASAEPPIAPVAATKPPQAQPLDAEPAITNVAATNTSKNALLEAFSKLFAALRPQNTATTETDMAAKLRLFLHTLAQALRPEEMHGDHALQVGGLVNVTA